MSATIYRIFKLLMHYQNKQIWYLPSVVGLAHVCFHFPIDVKYSCFDQKLTPRDLVLRNSLSFFHIHEVFDTIMYNLYK